MAPLARLTGAYVFFAAIATAVNLGSQWGLLQLWQGRKTTLAIGVAMVVGTGAGLAVKYVLDKRYIFGDRTTGAATHALKFTLYSMMGVATTVIFWGAELTADWIAPGGRLIYVGGAIGLTIGYVVKYQLDRRFVFRPTS